jgi:hypothetical protein
MSADEASRAVSTRVRFVNLDSSTISGAETVRLYPSSKVEMYASLKVDLLFASSFKIF